MIELSLSAEDVRAHATAAERHALESPVEHLAQSESKIAAIARAVIKKAESCVPSHLKVSKYHVEIRVKGTPFGVGTDALVGLELIPEGKHH